MKKKLIALMLILSAALCGMTSCGSSADTESEEADAAETAVETGVYPAEDVDSACYFDAEEAPEVIYSTAAEESGLVGSPYYVNGTVTKVYDSAGELLGEYGADASNLDDSLKNSRAIVIESEQGSAVFLDLVTCLVQNLSAVYGDNEAVLDAYLSLEYPGVSAEGYTSFPSEGETASVYGFYSGYSDICGMPVFYYGLTEYVHTMLASDSPEQETETYSYQELISIELPTSWAESAIETEDSVYFYPSSGMLLLQTGDMDDAYSDDQLPSLSEAYMDTFASSFDDTYTQSECTVLELDGGKATGCSYDICGYLTSADQTVDGRVVLIYMGSKLVTLVYTDYVTEDPYESGLAEFDDIVGSITVLQDGMNSD